MKVLKCIFLFITFALDVFGDQKTGCLVQGATQLYTNYIGLKDPYWANPSPTIGAYNGIPTAVDNRQFGDVVCNSYYITEVTGTDCYQYSNGSPPTFVSNGGNGKIATVIQKCVPIFIPLDDNLPLLFVVVTVTTVLFLRRKFIVQLP